MLLCPFHWGERRTSGTEHAKGECWDLHQIISENPQGTWAVTGPIRRAWLTGQPLSLPVVQYGWHLHGIIRDQIQQAFPAGFLQSWAPLATPHQCRETRTAAERLLNTQHSPHTLDYWLTKILNILFQLYLRTKRG